MLRRTICAIFLNIVAVGLLTSTFNIDYASSESSTIVVPDDYSTIQLAINHADEGDIIHVRNGIYYEHVVVDKSVSLIGENRSSTIIDGGGMGTGILVTASHATVQEFSVHDCEVGIKVESNNNVISYNMVASNGYNETEFLTNQEIYQDYVSPLSRWYVHNLINGSYTGFFNITGHTPAISVQALGREDVDQLGIALFHDKNDDHEPQLQEYVGYTDVKERNVQVFLVNPPIGRYIIKVLGWEVPEDLGHFNLEITKYAGYGIAFLSSRSNIITENIVTQNPVGLYLYDSHNSTILSNDAVENVGGIVVSNSSECVISNNNASLNKFGSSICRQFGAGLTLWSVHDFYISENNVSSNTFGIWLFISYDNELVGNSMLLNGGWGLGLHASHGNTVNRNNMSLTTGLDGVRLQFATQNNITQNCISHNNHAGIFLYLDNDNNSITGNKFYSNIVHGVELKFSDNNTIADNEVFYGGNGILIIESTGCTVRRNLVSSNHNGIMVYDSFENTIYHNSMMNNWEQQGLDARGSNLWDNSYPSGGNYWSDYGEADLYSGQYQNETGSDSLGDTPYSVNENNTDHYPLMGPWTQTGENVSVTHGTGVALTFSNITASGITTVNKTMEGREPPSGFKVASEPPFYYDVQTTANYTGNIRLEIPYNGTGMTLAEEINLKLMQWNETLQEWKDITTQVDTMRNVVYGEAAHLSLFGVFEKLLGDVDVDGDVDIFDIVRMAGAYGTKPPDPKYNSYCDIDGDGDIDIFDIVIAAGNYGKHW